MTQLATSTLFVASAGDLQLVLRPLGQNNILEALQLPRADMTPDEIERALAGGRLRRAGYAVASLPYGTLYVTTKPFEKVNRIENLESVRLTNIRHLREADRPDPVADVIKFLNDEYPNKGDLVRDAFDLEREIRDAGVGNIPIDTITTALKEAGFVEEPDPEFPCNWRWTRA